MPPESTQERTEAPTPRRREEARQSGQVGKSTDLTAAVILLGCMLMLEFTGRQILGRLLALTRHCLDGRAAYAADAEQMTPLMAQAFREAGMIVLPFLVLVVVLAVLVLFLQVGFLLTVKPLKPSFNKLNPINGLKRMFSARAVMQLVLGVAKMSLLSLVAYLTLKERVGGLAHASALPHLSLIAISGEMMMTLGIRLAIVLLLLGIIDLIYQRYKTERDMRMTKQEVKEELKRMDGDPEIKRRRREVQLQLAVQRLQSAVPKADVVVTNPTELAIAIRYDAAAMMAPQVIAKGADFLARRIREIAVLHGIPIVERKPLAQALFKLVEVGQEIPPQFYKAVAEILAYVYELAGGRRVRRAARRPVAASPN